MLTSIVESNDKAILAEGAVPAVARRDLGGCGAEGETSRIRLNRV